MPQENGHSLLPTSEPTEQQTQSQGLPNGGGDADLMDSSMEDLELLPTPGDGGGDDSNDLQLPTPPDGGWGWVIVFGSFMIHVIADGVAYSFGIFVVELLDYFHGVGRSEVGWIPSILIGVTWGSGPIASILVNKYGCRPVAIGGSLLGSVFLAISIFSPNVYFMYFSVGIMTGLGLGLAYLPAIVSVSYYFEKKRAFATGIAVCGSGVGTFVFAPLTALLIEMYGWQGAMLICAGLLLNCVVMGALFRPLEESVRSRKKSVSSASEEEELLEKPKLNGGVSHSDNFGQNGGIPNTHVSTEAMTTIDKHPQAAKDILCRNVLDRRMSNSAHAIPFLSQPTSLHNIHKYEKNLKRHASEDALHLRKRALHNAHESHHTEHKSPGPMNRKDIFYRASLHNIPMYRSNHDLYTKSMMSIPDSIAEEDVCCCMRCCSPKIQQGCSEMMDFSLLKDPVFLLFGISNLLTSIGFCVPYAYVPDRAAMHGVSKQNASFLLAVIGIANMVGRVFFGWVADRPNVNRLVLYNTALVLCGAFTAFSVYCDTFILMVVYCAGFGLFIGVYVAITPVVLVDLLGLDALTNSFGLTLLFQGIGAIIGPPIAGWIYDMTDSYDPPFVVTGIIVSLSGAMLYGLPCIQRMMQRHNGVTSREADLGKKVLEGKCQDNLPVA